MPHGIYFKIRENTDFGIENVDDFVAPFENFLDFDNFLNYSATNLKPKWPQKVKLFIYCLQLFHH